MAYIICVDDIVLYQSNCEDGICRKEVGVPPHISAWQYILSILIVTIGKYFSAWLLSADTDGLTAMGTTGTSLVILHKRLRVEHQRQLREYYHEQIRSVICP
jgi:hypothetical protein